MKMNQHSHIYEKGEIKENPRHSAAHPGFQGAAAKVAAKENIPMKNAERIIGAGKARASAAAREANPRLNRMGGHRGK
jgi:hypothetical protein